MEFFDKVKSVYEENKGKVTGTVVVATLIGMALGYFFDWISGILEFLFKIIGFFI